MTRLRKALWGIALTVLTVMGVGSAQAQVTGCPIGSTSILGCYRVDGTTITVNSGVISAIGSGAASLTVGTSSITGGASGKTLYDNAGVLGELPSIQAIAAVSHQFLTALTVTTSGGVFTQAAIGQTDLPPVTFAVGTTHGFVAPAEIWECSGTCTVTPPTPAAGYQFVVRNAPGVTTVITLAGVAGVLYEKTDFTGYGTANTAATSGGAAGDKICLIGHDSTHYDVGCFNGTWSVP